MLFYAEDQTDSYTAYFRAAKLVAFENEAHQVFQPQNSLVWNREFFGWLNKYLK